jgi:hypothetical protein
MSLLSSPHHSQPFVGVNKSQEVAKSFEIKKLILFRLQEAVMNAVTSYAVSKKHSLSDEPNGGTSIFGKVSSIIIASLFTASGLAIASLALAPSTQAQTAIIAALYQNAPMMIMEPSFEGKNIEQTNQVHHVKLAINSSPTVMAVADNIMTEPIYDRIVSIIPSQHFACLVHAQGSDNGSVMCGFIDYD